MVVAPEDIVAEKQAEGGEFPSGECTLGPVGEVCSVVHDDWYALIISSSRTRPLVAGRVDS